MSIGFIISVCLITCMMFAEFSLLFIFMFSLGSAAILEDKANSSKSRKKKKKDKKKNGDETASSSTSEQKGGVVSASDVVTAALHSTSTSGNRSATVQEQRSSSHITTTQTEVTSRDELVDHLLAMGFAEADCLQAILACGLDVDRAISWLCERPPPPAPTAKVNPSPNTSSGNHSSQSKDSSTKKITSSASLGSNTSAVGNVSSGLVSGAYPPDSELTPAQKAQKDKDHKEELRRINREWNAKVPQQRAEEEKKKAEADRAVKELERQRLLQQQLQAQYSMHSMFNAGPPLPQPGAGPVPTVTPVSGSAIPSSQFSQTQHIPGTFAMPPQQAPTGVSVLSSPPVQPQQSGGMSILGGVGSFPLMPTQKPVPAVSQTLHPPPFSRGASGGSTRQGPSVLSNQQTSFGMPSQQFSGRQQNASQQSSVSQPPALLLPSGRGAGGGPPGLSLGSSVPMASNLHIPPQGVSNSNMMLGGGFNSNIHSNMSDASPGMLHQKQQNQHQMSPSLNQQDSTRSPPQAGNHQPSSLFGMDSITFPTGSNAMSYESSSNIDTHNNDSMIMPFMNDVAGENTAHMTEEEYNDGVMNLSAVARPFIPKFTSSPSPKVSPPSGGQLGQGISDPLALPPLGAQSFSSSSHDWNVDMGSGGGSGSGNNGFLWQQRSSTSSNDMDMNKINENNSMDDAGFDMMSMNVPLDMDMLGGLDDLLQGPPSGEGMLPQHQGSLLDGLVSTGGSGGNMSSGMSQRQTSTSRFLNLSGDDDSRQDDGGSFFSTNTDHNSSILSSPLNDFMTNMSDHHSDFSPNNDLNSVFNNR